MEMVDKATESAVSTSDSRSKTMTARVSAVGTGVILVGFMVMTVSRAAFVATTDNVGNSASTGALTLTDNADYASGIATTFDPSGVDPTVDTRTFRFTIDVAANPDGAGQSGTFGFVWETQSP